MKGTTRGGSDFAVKLRQWPDECPRCHTHIHPRYITGGVLEGRGLFHAVFRCTRDECQGLFIGTYQNVMGLPYQAIAPNGELNLINLAPQTPVKVTYSEEISNLSPTFVEVVNQAAAADSIGLGQIVGIALRKALEFLVKDFAIAEHPDQEATIKKTWLGPCIETYIADPNVKACTSRAAWLGNDEAHYMRKWTDMDISDLRTLIRLTTNWIENVLLTKKYKEAMPQP